MVAVESTTQETPLVKRELLIVALVSSFTTICLADDGQTPAPPAAAVPGAATAAQRAARPRQVAVGTRATPTSPPSAALDSATGGTAEDAPASAGDRPNGSANSLSGGAAIGTFAATAPGTAAGTASATTASVTNVATTGTPGTATGPTGTPTPAGPQFASEAKWVLAGYNSDEIVYTVFVTNQDPRIIRCTTEVKGFYFENGTKLSIQDRQITTVFPNQPTRVGYWMDMDQQSGATYSVKCHPV